MTVRGPEGGLFASCTAIDNWHRLRRETGVRLAHQLNSVDVDASAAF
jgi:hypothetical protein